MPASSSTSLPTKRVISLVGYQGSGKTTLAKLLAKSLAWQHYEMSTIVKAVNTGLSRDELPATAERTKTEPNWLGEIVYGIIMKDKKDVVLSGVREMAIHDFLKSMGVEIRAVEIRCNPVTRFERLVELDKIHGTEHFLNHEVAEKEMGLPAVMHAAKYAVETTEESSPVKIVQAIRVKLTRPEEI